MDKRSRSRKKRRQYVLPKAGSSPGLVYIDENALKPLITLHQLNDKSYKIRSLDNLKDIAKIISDKNFTFWIEIRGFGSAELFDILGRDLNINKLVLEDITRTYQRPKMEEYESYVFAVSRMLLLDEDKNLENDQLSFILTDNALFTLKDTYTDCLEPVRQRLEAAS